MSVTFKDTAGREWSPKLTIGVAERVKEECGLDLIEANRGVEECGNVLTRLSSETDYQTCCLWHSCRAEAEARGVERQAFFDSFDGDTIEDGMTAFFRVLVNFTRKPIREINLRALEHAQTMKSMTGDNMPKILAKVDETLAEQRRRMEEAIG